jgi:phosphinothricin acetyltransferase
VIIRPARPDDADGILPILNHVIRDTAITFTSAEKTADYVRQEIIDRKGAYFVADRAGRVMGFATYFQFRGGPGYAHTMEHSIALAAEARGQGAGRALLDAVCAHARGQGAHSMWAGVSAENPAGVAFHARMGFEQVARLPEVGFKFGRWMDLILMQKIL